MNPLNSTPTHASRAVPSARPWVLLTGATQGIGRAIAERLASEGWNLAFTVRNRPAGEGLCAHLQSKGVEAKFFEVDLSDAAAWRSVLEEIVTDPDLKSGLKGLVCNAGISPDNLLLRVKPLELKEVMAVNFESAFWACQAALRPLMKNGGGSIVLISSVVGETGNPGQCAYASSKAALLGLTKSLAKEVASRQIRVNTITPGFIETSMTQDLSEQTKAQILNNIPLGRMGHPDEIAAWVHFLLSPGSSYTTGQILGVNGGLSM